MVLPAALLQLSKWMAKLSKHVHFLQADGSRRGAGDIQWNEPNESANDSFLSRDDMFIRPWKCVFLSWLSQSALTKMRAPIRGVCLVGVGTFAHLWLILLSHTSFSVTPLTNNSWKLTRGSAECQHLKYSMFLENLREKTQAALLLSPHLPSPQAVVLYLSMFPPRVSQRLLADLALTWPRKHKICSFLTEPTKFNTQPFSPRCKPCCPWSFRPSDSNW